MPKIDKNGNTVTTVRINSKALKNLKIRAVKRGITLRTLLQEILDAAGEK